MPHTCEWESHTPQPHLQSWLLCGGCGCGCGWAVGGVGLRVWQMCVCKPCTYSYWSQSLFRYPAQNRCTASDLLLLSPQSVTILPLDDTPRSLTLLLHVGSSQSMTIPLPDDTPSYKTLLLPVGNLKKCVRSVLCWSSHLTTLCTWTCSSQRRSSWQSRGSRASP